MAPATPAPIHSRRKPIDTAVEAAKNTAKTAGLEGLATFGETMAPKVDHMRSAKRCFLLLPETGACVEVTDPEAPVGVIVKPGKQK